MGILSASKQADRQSYWTRWCLQLGITRTQTLLTAMDETTGIGEHTRRGGVRATNTERTPATRLHKASLLFGCKKCQSTSPWSSWSISSTSCRSSRPDGLNETVRDKSPADGFTGKAAHSSVAVCLRHHTHIQIVSS